jgi:gamma-glutamyl:cysteine ligase YbdK (ATP-grasp superfamily)
MPLATIANILRKACEIQLVADINDAWKPRKPKAKKKTSSEVERLKKALREKDEEMDQERRGFERELAKKDRELRNKDRLIRKNGN